jgi:hypothetical protein
MSKSKTPVKQTNLFSRFDEAKTKIEDLATRDVFSNPEDRQNFRKIDKKIFEAKRLAFLGYGACLGLLDLGISQYLMQNGNKLLSPSFLVFAGIGTIFTSVWQKDRIESLKRDCGTLDTENSALTSMDSIHKYDYFKYWIREKSKDYSDSIDEMTVAQRIRENGIKIYSVIAGVSSAFLASMIENLNRPNLTVPDLLAVGAVYLAAETSLKYHEQKASKRAVEFINSVDFKIK